VGAEKRSVWKAVFIISLVLLTAAAAGLVYLRLSDTPKEPVTQVPVDEPQPAAEPAETRQPGSR